MLHHVLLDLVAKTVHHRVLGDDLLRGAFVETGQSSHAAIDRHVDQTRKAAQVRPQLLDALVERRPRTRGVLHGAHPNRPVMYASVRSSRGVVKSSSVLPYSTSRPTPSSPATIKAVPAHSRAASC